MLAKKSIIDLSCDVPQYYQLREDNACGPYVILMVADYLYKRGKGRKLFAEEWSRVLKITMRNDLTRDDGTSYKNLAMALEGLQFDVKEIRAKNDDARCEALREALRRDNPLIVGCNIPHRGKLIRHYVVLVGMDDGHFYFRDPFPYRGIKKGALKVVRRKTFLKDNPGPKDTVWGRQRWAVEVSVSGKRR